MGPTRKGLPLTPVGARNNKQVNIILLVDEKQELVNCQRKTSPETLPPGVGVSKCLFLI